MLVKFRSMSDVRDGDGLPLTDALRLGRLGRLLRSSSLDELPELWNVLWGDMSLVGPRPLLPEYVPLYSERQASRHAVRPGLTGWAQVNGRNASSWAERLDLDVWYVQNASLMIDAKIFLRTIVSVLAAKDINAPGNVTMPRFTGNVSGPLESNSSPDNSGIPTL